jgi:hypothetical protein
MNTTAAIANTKTEADGKKSCPPLTSEYLTILKGHLADSYVAHLAPLSKPSTDPAKNETKNLSRAFSAFALRNLLSISVADATAAVVDDFDDFGVDAIYNHAPSETVYLVQSKLKESEQLTQEEALAFTQGARKLLRQDFDGFNIHVQRRKTEIEDAIGNCANIQVVIAHIGSGINNHAKRAVEEFYQDEHEDEERLREKIEDYDATRVLADLRVGKAYTKIDTELWIENCTSINTPKVTYFGLVQVGTLAALHSKWREALYQSNIRNFLGHTTEVNKAIENTLATTPGDFAHLNNGVTALCQEIHPRGNKKAMGGKKRLVLKGVSVVNGAQTIASTARFVSENPKVDITTAKVALTLIKTPGDSDFGKRVTRARNHQNPVLLANFAALDDEQERLRRDLAHLDIHYNYKAQAPDRIGDPKCICIDEAVQSITVFQDDPRYAVRLKKNALALLDTDSLEYKELFGKTLSPYDVLNAVIFNRYIQERMRNVMASTVGQERLVYKHGGHIVAWILGKRTVTAMHNPHQFDQGKVETVLGPQFDVIRQKLWDATHPLLVGHGALGLFRNQTHTISLMERLMIDFYGLAGDPVLTHKKGQQKPEDPYPIELFTYLIQKAPQIGGLS